MAGITIGSNTIVDSAGYRRDVLHLIETQTASSSTTIDFVLPSGYFKFQVIGYNIIPATDNVYFTCRTSTDGGSTFDTTTYDSSGTFSYESASLYTGGFGLAAQTYMHLSAPNGGTTVGNGAAEGIRSLELNIIDPSTSAYTSISTITNYARASDGINCSYHGVGTRNVAEAVDAMQLLFSSGNIASGTFKLYGWVS